MASIRAVLVGVDEYERPDVPGLAGCVNDVALVRWLLKTCFGVPNASIRVVVNDRATKANILYRLQDVLGRAEPGDLVVFFFSGHGSQIRDRDGDELSDSLDEVLCPYDMDWDRRTFILDDDVAQIFATVPEGVTLEALFDCCFWGTTGGARELAFERGPWSGVRYLEPPFDILARAEGDEERLDVHRFADGRAVAGPTAVWAASQEGQPASEMDVGGRTNGVFTYWSCRFLAENADRIGAGEYTRAGLLRDLRASLRALPFEQHPELAAPPELRDAAPLLPGSAWNPWLAGGRGGGVHG